MVKLLATIGLLGLAGPARAASADSLFTDGNRAYFAGDHARAIECYETITLQEGVSPGLLHNLARAYQEQGDVGRALLNFERASWLAPRDAGIRAGLQTLRKDAALFADSDPRWARPFLGLSFNEWTWLGATAWAVVACLILSRGLGVKRFPFKSALAVSGLVLAMCVAGIATRLAQMDRAVVVRDSSPLRVSPYEAASQVASISEGTTLTATDSHGGFVKVNASGDQTGWIAASNVEMITMLDQRRPNDAGRVACADNNDLNATDGESGG
jgi:hypothetical protein